MPRISVVMGVYNCRDFRLLDKSVESIVHQSYTDWELLICNDGSTDDTLEYLINTVSARDGRIKILSYDENHGLAYALNYCIDHALGTYIARQDDDDMSFPDRFEKEVRFLDSHMEYALVGTAAEVYDDSGIWGSYAVPEKPNKESFYWNSPFIHPSVVVRREVYEACNGYRIAKETGRCEDYDLFMRIYAKGYRGYNIQEKLYSYRMEKKLKSRHRKMRFRIDETIVRFKGYRKMGVLIGGMPYVIKPILVGMLPISLLNMINKMKHCR